MTSSKKARGRNPYQSNKTPKYFPERLSIVRCKTKNKVIPTANQEKGKLSQ